MSRLWHGGAEAQAAAELPSVYGAAIDTAFSAARVAGAASWKLSGNVPADDVLGADLPALGSQTKLYVKQHVYIDNLPNAPEFVYYFDLMSSGGVSIASLNIWNDGGTLFGIIYYNDFAGSSSSFSTNLAFDQRIRIEILYDSTPANGSEVLEVRINGTTVVNLTNLNFTNKSVAALDFGVYNGLGSADSTAVVYVDDIAVNNASGSVNNSWIGEEYVVAAIPNASGDNNPDAGDYSSINEVPWSDTATNNTNRIELDNNGSIADFAITNAATLGINSYDLISAIMVLARLREETSTTTSYQLRLKSAPGGALQQTTAADVGNATLRTNPNGTTAFGRLLISETDPTTAAPWTPTGTNSLDNAQIGVQSANNNDFWVTSMAAMVAFSPGTPPAGDPPTVDTAAATDLDTTTATLNGGVTDDDGSTVTRRGFVLSTSPISDPGDVDPDTLGLTVIDESGSFGEEAFDLPATSLTHSTGYYVRAFAENSAGFGYGDQVTFTTTTPNAKAATLTDNFNDNSIDTGKWAEGEAGSATVAEQNNKIEIDLPASATATSHASLTSQDRYDLLSSHVSIETTETPNSATNADAELIAFYDSDNWVRIVLEAGTLYFQRRKAADQATVDSIAFNPVTHKWWRLLETGGDVHFDTSPDGKSWTTRATYTHGMAAKLDDVLIQIGAYCYQNETNPGGFNFDNVNLYLPSVDTDPATSVGDTSATLNGEVIDNADLTVTRRGFVLDDSAISDPGNAAPESIGGVTIIDESGSFGEATFSLGASSLTPETAYHYRAFAQTAAGFSYGAQQDFTTEEPAENAPTVALNTPDEQEFDDDTPELEFTGSDEESDPITYQIQIDDTNNSFGSIVIDKLSGSDPGFTNKDNGGDTDPFNAGDKVGYQVQGADALPNGTYYWRVRGKDPAGSNTFGAWSEVREFIVNMVDDSPTVTPNTPDEHPFTTDTPTLEFTGNDPESSDVAYEVQIDNTSNAFGTVIIDAKSDEDEGFANIDTPADTDPFNSGDKVGYTVPAVGLPIGTYHWRVRAKDPGGSNAYGAWSTPRSFTVSIPPVSEAFKAAAKNPIKPEIRASIVFGDLENPTEITDSDDLAGFKIEAAGSLLKTSMRKITVKLVTDTHNFIITPTYVRPSWGLKVPIEAESEAESEGETEQWEDIGYGSFLITEQTSDKEKGTMTISGYDLMIGAYGKYSAASHSYPCTLAQFLQQICDAIGVRNGMAGAEFLNDDLEITEVYENISDITYRDILDDIAEATCSQIIIGRDDHLHLKPVTETNEELNDSTLKRLKLEPPFGAVNSVVLSRMPTNDNIALYEGESETEAESESEAESEAEPLNLVEVKIINNELLDKRREETIQSLYNSLYGLAFTPFDATTIGLGWYEIGDRLTIDNNATEFSCVILNYVLEIDGSVKERLYTNAPTKTATAYERAGGMLRHLYNTEITVDKQQQFIESLVSDMYGEDGLINESFTQILQDLTQVITSVQNAGGNNLIKNSACYAVDGDGLPVSWTPDVTGSLIIEPSQEAVARGSLSGNIIRLVDAKITQRVSVKPDSPELQEDQKTYYSFAFKVKKSLVGTGYVKLYNALETHIIEFEADDESDYAVYEFTGLLPLQNYYDVEVYGDGDSDMTVTDMILAVGAYSQQWQQANGEFANTQVQINVDGVTVRSSTFLGTYTTMTPLAFSGYKDGELVFSIDVNGLQVKKALIAETITMQPIKLVKMTGGIAFVPGTEE